MSDRSDLTHEDVLRILQIVDEASDVEVRVEIDGLKLHVQKGNAGAPAPAGAATAPVEATAAAPASAAPPAAEPAAPAEPAVDDSPQTTTNADPAPGTEVVRAPMLGRFFLAPSPMEPPYVEPGQQVGPDDPVCLLEVMKVFNTVRAGLRGTVVDVLVEDQEMVEQDQPLFVIKTS